MKKTLSVITFLILSSFQTFAQIAKSPTYVINGNLKGIDSGKVYSLSADMKVIDSAIIAKGKFILSGNLNLDDRQIFRISPGRWEFGAFVDAPRITLDIDTFAADHEYFKGEDWPVIRRVKHTGSAFADIEAKYRNATGAAVYFALGEKLKFAGKDSVVYIRSKRDSILKLMPQKQKLWVENYVRQNPESIQSIFIFNQYYDQLSDASPVYLRSMIGKFSGAANATPHYKALADKLQALEGSRAGKPAPDFTLLKRDKRKFKLSTTRGSVTMLDFWASWCVPCRAGIPGWKKVYAKYHDKGLNIVSVSIDKIPGDWVKALDQEKMPWTQVIDDAPSRTSKARVSELFGTNGVPHFVLIDKEGTIVISSNSEHAVKKKIEEMFKSRKKAPGFHQRLSLYQM